MTPPPHHPLRLAYYADDFTGATDALEQLEMAGVPTALFLAPPSPDKLAEHPQIEAIGVAGCTRSLATSEIQSEAGRVLPALRKLKTPHVHYKVCSTFDSSPEVGNIGRVIDVAAETFNAPFIPLVVGSPKLGRWCVFGNLFAGVGIGAETEAHRLDRHPSMSRHPVTPANEADLRLHLGRQTTKRIGLIDVRVLDGPPDRITAAIERLLRVDSPEVILFDCLTTEHLTKIGEVIEQFGSPDSPLFSVGSSAIESALSAAWTTAGQLTAPLAIPREPIGAPLLVLAGSCSPVSFQQIEQAKQVGFTIVPISASRLASDSEDGYIAEISELASRALDESQGVIVTTMVEVSHSKQETSSSPEQLNPKRLGAAFGKIFRSCSQRAKLAATIVIGGDTSSYTARSLDVESLTLATPLTPGAPLCHVQSADPLVDGGLFVFKGGQVGRPDFLASLLESPSAVSPS